MAMTFNADEILGMALQIERNGAAFYKRAAQLGQSSSARALLLELAAMEEDHEKTFSEMKAGLTEDERREMTYDPQGELPFYLEAFADKSVFKAIERDAAKSLAGSESVEQILGFAIGMEKDSIVFYLGLQDLVPQRLGGERVDAILKEEMGHLASLGDMLRCSQS